MQNSALYTNKLHKLTISNINFDTMYRNNA